MTLIRQLFDMAVVIITGLALAEAVHKQTSLKGYQKAWLWVWVSLLVYTYIERVILWQ